MIPLETKPITLTTEPKSQSVSSFIEIKFTQKEREREREMCRHTGNDLRSWGRSTQRKSRVGRNSIFRSSAQSGRPINPARRTGIGSSRPTAATIPSSNVDPISRGDWGPHPALFFILSLSRYARTGAMAGGFGVREPDNSQILRWWLCMRKCLT